MLYADARSVREERSRQRYALQDFSLVRVSLVKGKRSWKIGSIEAKYNYYYQAANKEARGSVVALCRFLRRFVKGEEPLPELFVYVIAALEVCGSDVAHRAFVDQALQVCVLSRLGYVDRRRLPTELAGAAPAQLAPLHSPELTNLVESLYTHAVASSHL